MEPNRECPDLGELTALLDGECSPEEARRIRGHLERCAGCRGTLAALEAADAVVRQSDPASSVPVDVDRLVSGVHARLASPIAGAAARGASPWRRRVRLLAGATAAAAAVIFLVTLALHEARTRRSGAPSGPHPAGGPTVAGGASGEVDRPEQESSVPPTFAEAVPAGPGSGIRTLARIDEDWPRECRERAGEILEAAGPAFPESREEIDRIFAEIRPLGRYAVPALRTALAAPQDGRSRLAFEILLRLGFETTLPDLVEGAGRHGRVEALLDLLEEMGSPDAAAVAARIAHDDPAHRDRAIEILGSIPGRDALAGLLTLARPDSDADLAPSAIAAIGSRNDPDSVNALLDLYAASGGDRVAALAIRSNAEAAAPIVRRRLRAVASEGVEPAIEIAGLLRDRAAAPALRDLLRDERLRPAAARALLEIGDPSALPDVLMRLDPGDGENGASEFARIARGLDAESLRELERLAREKKGEVGRRAAILLGRAGAAAVPHLAAVLQSGNHRTEVTDALARLDTDDSRAVLREALDDRSRCDRVVDDLLARGHGELALALLRSLYEDEGSARARRALARLEPHRDTRSGGPERDPSASPR